MRISDWSSDVCSSDLVYRLANPSAGERLAVLAVGGYGRSELAPRSDIDLLFLLPYKMTPHAEQVVEYMLYLLWDLDLQVGHAARSIEECLRQAKRDWTIHTHLLRSEERRVGKEFVSRCRTRWW